MKHLKKLALTTVIVYVIAVHGLLYQYHQQVDKAQERVYQVAYLVEFWKKVAVEHQGNYFVEDLKKDPTIKAITPITHTDGLPQASRDKQYYSVQRNVLSDQDKVMLKRYFSDNVLSHYHYLVTDNDKRIEVFEWDKP